MASRELRDKFRGWPAGVIATGRPERNPRTSAFHGYNSILTNVNTSGATPTTRPGWLLWNADKTHNGAITSLTEYRVIDPGGSVANYLVYTGDDGSFGTFSGFTPTEIGTGAFLSGNIPSAAAAKNRLFMTDGGVNLKLWGSTLQSWGITRPSEEPSVSAGAAGIMTGHFEVRYSFRNSTSGHESSTSDSSLVVSLTNQQLNISSIHTSSDTQVDETRIYIRNRDNQTAFRLAAAIPATDISTTLNVDTSTLIILGPSTTENEPPPSGIKHCAWVNSFMFVANDDLLFYSKQGDPESFDSTFEGEPIGAGDGQKITGLYAFGDLLLIFKNKSTYLLEGSTTSTFRITPLFTDIGALTERSIVTAHGAVWWWSHLGPVRWDGTKVDQLGKLLLNLSTLPSNPNIQAGLDQDSNLLVWTFPIFESSRNDGMVAFHTERVICVSDKWDGLDACSLATTTSGLNLGGYNGQMFNLGGAQGDGVPSGTRQGTFVAGSDTITSITGTGFFTDSKGNLVERYVTVQDTQGQVAFNGRQRITANTSTVLTLAGSIINLIPGDTYTYYIGAANFEWHTAAEDADFPFEEKDFKSAYLAVATNSSPDGDDTHIIIDTFVGFLYPFELLPKRTKLLTIDSSSEESQSVIRKKYSIAAVGASWMQRIACRQPHNKLTILEIAMASVMNTDKLG